MFCQEVKFTYKKKTNTKFSNKNINDGYYYANIDHILFALNSSKIEMLQSNILDDVLNMSDHRVVTCNFNIHCSSAE